VIGSHEDIQNAKVEDVREFFKSYYVPNNATLVIAGDIDKAKTKALVTKYFASIPRGNPIPPIQATTPPITSEHRAKVTDEVELPRVFMGWVTSPIFKPATRKGPRGRHPGRRKSKPPLQDARVRQADRAGRECSLQSLALGSVFEIVATAKPGHTAEELEAAIDAEIQKLATDGPTPAELAASQTSTYSGIVSSLERNRRVRRRGRPDQHVQPAHQGSSLLEPGSRAVRGGHPRRRQAVRRGAAGEGPPRGRVRPAGQKGRFRPPRQHLPRPRRKRLDPIEGALAQLGTRRRLHARREAPDGEALPASRTV